MPGNLMLESRPAEKDEEGRGNRWNKRSSALSGRFHPANPVTCERKRPKKISIPKKQLKLNNYANVLQEEGQIPSQDGHWTGQL